MKTLNFAPAPLDLLCNRLSTDVTYLSGTLLIKTPQEFQFLKNEL